MDRRKAIRLAGASVVAGGAGVLTLSTAFKPVEPEPAAPKKLALEEAENSWGYLNLDINETAKLAYKNYPKGSCMYGVSSSIIEQLSEKVGEPYSSFPLHMMKYGHGGIAGEGTTCGTLNGAAAVLGLLIKDKTSRDVLIADLFHWYEKSAFPNYKPEEPYLDFDPPVITSKSVLCHASSTRWCNETGFKIGSDERKERCKRMTADVAAKTVELLNKYFGNEYVAGELVNESAVSCLACHGSKGKVGNTSGKMDCESCHDESLGHKVFGDVHYKLMK